MVASPGDCVTRPVTRRVFPTLSGDHDRYSPPYRRRDPGPPHQERVTFLRALRLTPERTARRLEMRDRLDLEQRAAGELPDLDR